MIPSGSLLNSSYGDTPEIKLISLECRCQRVHDRMNCCWNVLGEHFGADGKLLVAQNGPFGNPFWPPIPPVNNFTRPVCAFPGNEANELFLRPSLGLFWARDKKFMLIMFMCAPPHHISKMNDNISIVASFALQRLCKVNKLQSEFRLLIPYRSMLLEADKHPEVICTEKKSLQLNCFGGLFWVASNGRRVVEESSGGPMRLMSVNACWAKANG